MATSSFTNWPNWTQNTNTKFVSGSGRVTFTAEIKSSVTVFAFILTIECYFERIITYCICH